MDRYEAVFGFNTKQWWVYDSKTDEWCDPPIEVLNIINNLNTLEEKEAKLIELASDPNNDWINDVEYRYDAEFTDI